MTRTDQAAWGILLLGGGVIATALASEIWGGLQPCPLCLQQRLPYYTALPLAAVALAAPPIAARGLLAPIAAIFAVGAGLAVYHSGIEYGWWAGSAACGGAATFDSIEALQRALEAPAPRCDEPAFRLWGCLLYTSPSPRDATLSRMPSSA